MADHPGKRKKKKEKRFTRLDFTRGQKFAVIPKKKKKKKKR